jgi:hypothetical protein
LNKKISAVVLSLWAAGSAFAADYTVGINGIGTGSMSGGVSLNLYKTSDKGVELVKGSPFTYAPRAASGSPSFSPTSTLVDPDNNFAYVVYENYSLPVLVKFAIKPTGLVFVWQSTVTYGGAPQLLSARCDGPCLAIVGDYTIEKTYPVGLWVNILNSSGQSILVDNNGNSVVNASHIAGTFYFSCRNPSQGYDADEGSLATSVAVYNLDQLHYASSDPSSAVPLVKSADPVYVQSVCGVQR